MLIKQDKHEINMTERGGERERSKEERERERRGKSARAMPG